MSKIKKMFFIFIMSIIMTSCALNQRGTFFPLGAGLFGALACNQIFKGHGSKKGWTAACGVGGYLLGSTYTQRSSQALDNNRIGQTSRWSDPDGRQYSMTPTDTYYQRGATRYTRPVSGATPCRTYRTAVEIDGRTEILTGRACRQNDGTWKAIQ